ncbi:hypothetical protein LWI29_028995 [Acer saccharum]|uniref:RNA methyltransferase n=1 Tax=Acer saccharum TaxID=4024 RepID=A0AA39VAE0_ACESA|nr:hypothetical protein LWI29_028995 [Acer saccharum]
MMTISVSGCSSVYAKNSIQSPGKQCKYTGQSVRALPVRILTVGKKRSPGVQLLVDEYILKLKHYCSVDDVLVRSNPKNARDVRAQVEDEDAAVIGHIGSDDWVVMLDENGLDIGSEKMAELVGGAGNTGASRLSFCIGGPYGHGRKMRERANMSIKLSSMVLNHQIALLVLMEQLYRSITDALPFKFQVMDYSERPKLPSLGRPSSSSSRVSNDDSNDLSSSKLLFHISTPDRSMNKYYLRLAQLEDMTRQQRPDPSGNNREYLIKLERALYDIGHEEEESAGNC